MTLFVGKVRFKRNRSKLKSSLQSPVAVAALRGTELWWQVDHSMQGALALVEGHYATIFGYVVEVAVGQPK